MELQNSKQGKSQMQMQMQEPKARANANARARTRSRAKATAKAQARDQKAGTRSKRTSCQKYKIKKGNAPTSQMGNEN